MRIAPQWANRRTLSEHRDLDELFRLSHLNIPTPKIWFRAEDYEGDISSGSPPGALRDRMPDPSDFSVAFTGALPTNVLNGRPVFRFSNDRGVGRRTDLDLTGDFTVALVGHVDSTSGVNPFISESAGGENQADNILLNVSSRNGNWNVFHEHGGGNNESVDLGSSDTSDHVFVWQRDTSGTEYSLKIDGGAATTGGYTTNPDGGGNAALRMPGEEANTFSGDIAELLLWDHLLGANAIATVESYLNARYATF